MTVDCCIPVFSLKGSNYACHCKLTQVGMNSESSPSWSTHDRSHDQSAQISSQTTLLGSSLSLTPPSHPLPLSGPLQKCPPWTWTPRCDFLWLPWISALLLSIAQVTWPWIILRETSKSYYQSWTHMTRFNCLLDPNWVHQTNCPILTNWVNSLQGHSGAPDPWLIYSVSPLELQTQDPDFQSPTRARLQSPRVPAARNSAHHPNMRIYSYFNPKSHPQTLAALLLHS